MILVLHILLLILLIFLHPLIIHIINTNHIFIGGVYIIFELIGGRLSSNSSIIIRSESALPGSIIRSSLQYNSCITFHGILTIFSMIMPISTGGLGNILSPLLLCCCETISIRLNALSPRLSLNSPSIPGLSSMIDGGVNAGRTSHVPPPRTNYPPTDSLSSPSHIAGLPPLSSPTNSTTTPSPYTNPSTYHHHPYTDSSPRSTSPTSSLLTTSSPASAGRTTTTIPDRHPNPRPSDPSRGGDPSPSQHPP